MMHCVMPCWRGNYLDGLQAQERKPIDMVVNTQGEKEAASGLHLCNLLAVPGRAVRRRAARGLDAFWHRLNVPTASEVRGLNDKLLYLSSRIDALVEVPLEE